MAEGRNLTQEIDDLRSMMEGMRTQNDDLKKMLAEALNKNNDRTDHREKEKVNYPPGYEMHDGGHPHWNEAGWEEPGWNENRNQDWEKQRLKEELEAKMQEQFKALRGPSPYGPMGIQELCLAPNVVMPHDFKMPEFIKFNGSTNPIMHLKMYCTKMGIWSRDEKFLISLFLESLDGAAWEWYMQLDKSQIKCWEDLAMAFTNQYKFNLNAAPTRDQLKAMRKKNNETFKEYAQRWRAVAAQVIPPMLESEMCSYFIKTLEGPYFNTMLGTHVKEFVDLIEIGERIEANIQEGKLELQEDSGENQWKKGQISKRKEGTVNTAQFFQPPQFRPNKPKPRYHQSYQYSSHHTPMPYTTSPHQTNDIPQPQPYIPITPLPFQINNIPQPQPYTPNTTYPFQTTPPHYQPTQPQLPPHIPPRPNHIANPRPQMETRPFPNFHMSKIDLFTRLRGENLIAPLNAKPLVPPYPRWYNPNVSCAYHSNNLGHSIEDCYAFRQAVWQLLDNKLIEIQEEEGPSIKNNPFPNYGPRQVNALESEEKEA